MARTKSKAVPVGTKVFGKVAGALVNLNSWLKHDHAKHWSTANDAGETIGTRIGQIIDNTVAKETKEAVKDYAGDAEFGLSVVEGHIVERARLYNADASLVVQVDLFEQLLTTVREAKQTLADPQSQAMLSAIAAGALKLDHEIKRNSIQPMEIEPDPPSLVGGDDDVLESFR